jgi:hypothetical protein
MVVLYKSSGQPRPPVKVSTPTLSVTSEAGIQHWTGDDIAKICRAPMLLSRLAHWNMLAAAGMPTLRDLYNLEDASALDHAMVMLQFGDDFIYVHQGAEMLRTYGLPLRGAVLSQLEGPLTSAFLELFNACLRAAQPIYIQFIAEFSERHVGWERLLLPAVADGVASPKFLISYSLPMDDKAEILTAVFEKSHVGMIAAAPPIGKDRSLDEARVLMINARARDMLKLPPTGALVHTIRDLRRWMREVLNWAQGTTTLDRGNPVLHYSDLQKGRRITISVEPVGRFVIYSLSET